MKRVLIFILVLVVVAALGITGYLYMTRSAEIPTDRASFVVLSGKAAITQATGQKLTLDTGKQGAVGTGDVLQVDGKGKLTGFGGVEADLAPGTQLEIKKYSVTGDSSQIDLLLKAGQVVQNIPVLTSAQASYSLSTSAATLTTRGGKMLIRIAGDGSTQVGVAYGTATASAKGAAISLKENQGTVVAPGQAPVNVQPWSQVHVPTYRPDGSAVALPVTMEDEKSGEHYDFSSDELFLLPVSSYTLTINLLTPYQAKDILLVDDGFNELPVTLSEVTFVPTDSDGKPVGYTGLTVKNSDQSARAVPDTPLIISPGQWKVLVAREEKPDAIQPIALDIAPGARTTIPLRNDLFGGGSVKIDLAAPDGVNLGPLTVSAYQKGNETGDPYAVFKTDGPSEPLPAGDYVLVIQSRIGARYPVTVPENQTVSVPVQFSTVTINYVDAQNRPIARSAMVYLALAAEVQRLGLKVDEMRRTPFGIAVNLSEAKKLVVPAGVYDVLINDRTPAEKDNNPVAPGQTVTINVPIGAQ